MPARTRSRGQVLADRAVMAEKWARGWTQYAIAQELGLTREQVAYDMRQVFKEWRKSAIIDLNDAKMKQLHRYEVILKETWVAWENSKRPRDITTTRQKRRGLSGTNAEVPMDQTTEAGKRTEQRDPNAAYMQIILDTLDAINKLLGLYAPTETRHSGMVAQITEISYEPAPPSNDARLVVIGAGDSLKGTNGHAALPY